MKYPESIPIFELSPSRESIFYNWVLEEFRLYIKPRVLVLGDRTDVLVNQLIKHKLEMHLAFLDYSLLNTMSKNPSSAAKIKTRTHLNLFESNFKENYAKMLGMFGTIISLETADYSADYKTFLTHITLLLRPGGHLLSAPPSFTAFFSGSILSEEEWGEWERKSLQNILHGYQLLKLRHFISDNLRPQVVNVAKKI